MKIYINDIPVEIVKLERVASAGDYDLVIDGSREQIEHQKLLDHVLVTNASKEHVELLLERMTNHKFKLLDRITFAVADKKEVQRYIKQKFKVVKAAGGIVRKADKVLLIYRLRKWDLPKGKLDPGEDWAMGAQREVEEETGAQVVLGSRICKTWHTYLRNGKYNLKKTVWYAMDLVDDGQLQPQVEEDIEEVRFMDRAEVRQAMYNSYRTIRHVLKTYYTRQEATSQRELDHPG